MDIICPSCSNTIRLEQMHIYHAGFSNLGFLYCDTCPNILEFSTYNRNYVAIVGGKHPWTLVHKDKKKVEDHLRQCSCGGKFKFDLKPRCPYCKSNLESFPNDNLHFLEIGDVVNADCEDGVWI